MNKHSLSLVGVIALLINAAPAPSTAAPVEAKYSEADYDSFVKEVSSEHNTESNLVRSRLEQAGQLALPALLRGFDTASPRGKAGIAIILSGIKGKDDEIASDLGRKWQVEIDTHVREAITDTISRYRGPTAALELKKIAEGDQDERIRATAIHSVAHISHSNETVFFKKKTLDLSPYVRLSAYYELANLEDTSGRELALEILRGQPESWLRRKALDVLGRAGTAADLPYLKGLADLKDRDYSIALAAYYHLRLLQLPRGKRLDNLIQALDDPQMSWWAGTELHDCPSADTNARLRAYLQRKDHGGANEAYNALDSRQKDEWRPYHIPW